MNRFQPHFGVEDAPDPERVQEIADARADAAQDDEFEMRIAKQQATVMDKMLNQIFK